MHVNHKRIRINKATRIFILFCLWVLLFSDPNAIDSRFFLSKSYFIPCILLPLFVVMPQPI